RQPGSAPSARWRAPRSTTSSRSGSDRRARVDDGPHHPHVRSDHEGTTMLDGETCRLRLVRESDLDVLAELEEDVANRGAYFPHGVVPRARLARDLAETGLWQDTEGLLLIVDDADLVLGHIEFFPTVGYLDEVELS